MTHQWIEILSSEQIKTHYALTNKLDRRFSISQRQYYETRSIPQLRALVCGAWTANDAEGYQLARSYLARAERR